MPEYVRVRDRHTGHEYDVVATAVSGYDHEVLTDYPPSRGWPRPAKFRTDKAGRPVVRRSTAPAEDTTTAADEPANTEKE